MSKLTDTILRSYNSSVIIAQNADTDAALQKAIESATAFMFCSEERRADLYARLIEAKFVELTGIERRIKTTEVIRRWNYDHMLGIESPLRPLPDPADAPVFEYPEPEYNAEAKKWIVDTKLGELVARDLFDEEPTSGDLIATRDNHEQRLRDAAKKQEDSNDE